MIPAGQCAAPVLDKVLRGQPLSDAKVRFAWTVAVGAAIGRATTVRLRPDGALAVRAASDAWRSEIHRSRGRIRERLAGLLGQDVITRIEVTS